MLISRFGSVAAVLLASVVAIAPGGCIQIGGANQQKTASMQAPHVPASGIEVQAHNGSVKIVRAAVSEVTIRANVRMTTVERLEATVVAADRQANGVLLIRATPPEGKWQNSEGCSFEITAPDVAGVTVATNNGGIMIEGLGGNADLSSSNGSVVVRDQGGSVKAHTSNGRVEVRNAHGPVAAETSNGSMVLDLADDSPGPITARTSNGGIDLRLGRAFAGTLDLATSNGSVRCPEAQGVQVKRSGRTSAAVIVGSGGSPSVAKTSNGGITVRR